MSKILITGCAGFIGFHLTKLCLSQGNTVLGIDSLNEYYDVNLKNARLEQLSPFENFSFAKQNIAEVEPTHQIIHDFKPDYIVHLAAQAGVRYSLENPYAYIESNLQGFTSIIEAARLCKVKHLVYASSSSVYGANTCQPFSETDSLNHPLSIYAASKKANELIAHSYSNLYDLPTTGLRFFTAYGPWGRPDMALFLFTKNILAGKPIDVFNYGDMVRDFTYVGDVAEAVSRLITHIAKPDESWSSDKPNPATSNKPYRIYNVGNSKPQKLLTYIAAIEDALGIKAKKNLLPLQPGDVPSTCADVQSLEEAIGFKPATDIADGVKQFVDWYLEFYPRESNAHG